MDAHDRGQGSHRVGHIVGPMCQRVEGSTDHLQVAEEFLGLRGELLGVIMHLLRIAPFSHCLGVQILIEEASSNRSLLRLSFRLQRIPQRHLHHNVGAGFRRGRQLAVLLHVLLLNSFCGTLDGPEGDCIHNRGEKESKAKGDACRRRRILRPEILELHLRIFENDVHAENQVGEEEQEREEFVAARHCMGRSQDERAHQQEDRCRDNAREQWRRQPGQHHQAQLLCVQRLRVGDKADTHQRADDAVSRGNGRSK
mmetsp:Transcript_9446/g.15003  ORF Transcript_9446/g.15003 Transcript_9446/m.15003 type:complete len:255 (-) Transcript_9446:545-1309(-)